MKTISKLTGTVTGLHLADQVALVGVPMTAVLVFGASPEMIGMLVACQSLAHLLGSLPFGILVDRAPLKLLVIAATLISAFAFAGTALSLYFSNLAGFTASITLAGFGIVLFSLTVLSIVPLLSKSENLSQNNATIELPRTLASFLVPLLIAAAIAKTGSMVLFLLATLAATASFCFSLTLPNFEKANRQHEGMLTGLLEGGKFVLHNAHLRAISICAVFWNLAFTALLVVLVPLLAQFYSADVSAFGNALGAFGLGAVAGMLTTRQLSGRIAPYVLLIFGPAISVLASLLVFVGPQIGGTLIVYCAFFLFGFGPSMWLITQNTVRQLVTPAHILGRVNSVIQTTIYGMRPLGAIIGGSIVGATSPQTGLLVVAGAFLLSFCASVFSPLLNVKRYADIAQPANAAA